MTASLEVLINKHYFCLLLSTINYSLPFLIMNFALRQMKAMGWSEGKGLGASEDGITTSIKPSTQKDTRGLGFTIEDSLQLKNQWWSEAYNAASKGLQSELKITSVGVIVKPKKRKSTVDDDEVDGSKSKSMYNDRFVSAGLLENKNAEENDGDGETKSEEIADKKKKRKSKKLAKEEDAEEQEEGIDADSANKSTSLDFNKIFKNAKGMTCHKAARLGIQMNGKMKRIQEQEEEFLKKHKR